VSGERSGATGAEPSALTPAAIVDALDRRAKKFRTPCGDGSMVWRVWGKGEPLLLFHGGSGSWTHWLRNIPELARHYQLWVPDLPGLGQSAMPPEPLVPATSAEVIVAGLAAARLRDRIGVLTLIGVAALGLRAEPRERFAKQRPGMTVEEVAAVFHQNLRVLMFANPANIDALAIHLQAENIKRARFRSRPFATSNGLAKALAHVTAPLQTIWGREDIIARGSLEARLEIMRQHHTELEVRLLDKAGHWVAYEAADRFNAALLELLSTVGRKS
jgi:pimeloyl-ACP methyl ester carboxylesterase